MPTTVVNDNLDDNILSEILIRLPAKTLGRLKVINKRWYSLISDPFFVNKHTSLQTNRNASSFIWRLIGGSINLLSFDRSSPGLLSETTIFIDPSQKFRNTWEIIEASCHGLLLVQFSTCICIFNPLTKKKQVIQIPSELFRGWFGLVFGPTSSSPYYYNHYNVVCLFKSETTIKFKIFNQEKGCWRDSKKNTWISYDNGLDLFLLSNPVHFRGIIHWLNRKGDIIAFNLDKEESRLIEVPKRIYEMVSEPNYYCWWGSYRFEVVEDEVNLVLVTDEKEILIWVQHDYENNKWKLKKKDVIKREKDQLDNKPIFFDGARLILHVYDSDKGNEWKSYWQEHDIQTGASGPLCPTGAISCFPHICTLTEVFSNNHSTELD